jgi:adenylosuccinate synthase
MRAAVFEGAQGLALDEHFGEFPHVTRSMTGLPYAIVAAAELNIETLQPVYVTRSYLTRHGAGHLEFEGVDFGGTPVDATNIPNDWQGTLRFAPLNLQMLKHYIGADIQRGTEVARAHGIALQPATLALTCMDQLGSTVSVVDVNGTLKTMPTYELPALLTKRLGYHISHMSLGPKASDVQFFQFGV